ncbi:type II toxin-antitoxin system VapC family toxin [Haloferula sp.]|uniref:type II toxin-antitoxin system VapC family toxin n=1 Tax=Haloferula sp. TaxID=2497595 RepID=UPI003C7961A2
MFLLDTDTCIFFMRGEEEVLENARKEDRLAIHVSTISLFELRVGLEKGSLKHAKLKREKLENLVKLFSVVDFGDTEAVIAARVRADLEKRGKKIGPYDTLLAGVALAKRWTLVTNNSREFSRVKGLKLVNWKG